VVLNAHGGNNAFLRYFAMSQLDRKVDYTLYIINYFELSEYLYTRSRILEDDTGGHAREGETSSILAIQPDSVKMEYHHFPEPIQSRPLLSHLEGVFTGLWWYAEYPENVSGSPSKATFEKGSEKMGIVAQAVAARIRAIKKDEILPAFQQEYYNRTDNVKNNI